MTSDLFHLPLAQSGLSFVIYLIVGVFWLAGNIMQQKRAKQKAREMKEKRLEREREAKRTGKKPARPNPLEQDLEVFLKRLSGESPVARTPHRPPPLPKAESDIQFDQEPPPSLPRPPPQVPPSVKPPREIGSLDLADSFEEMAELQDAVELSYDQVETQVQDQALESVRQVMVDLSATTINMPRVPAPRMRTVRTQTTAPDLKNKNVLKKAVVAGVLLEPPLALRNPGADGR